jgi:nitrite reductase (NADH) small subunit
MALVEVAEFGQLKDNVPFIVSAAGREICLIQRSGTVHAVRNVCPHQTASFAGGVAADERVPGGLKSRVEYDPNQPIIACPWHRWHFSLVTGVCTVDDGLRVKVYPVTVQEGKVLVDMGREARREETVESAAV